MIPDPDDVPETMLPPSLNPTFHLNILNKNTRNRINILDDQVQVEPWKLFPT